MPTPDGISKKDWDTVHELSVDIVNARGEAEANILTKRLLAYLKELEDKYGPLPSILATRADYVSDPGEKLSCLRQAYALAEATCDTTNMAEIAHSLAEFYIEDMGDVVEGRIWLMHLQHNTKGSTDKFLLEDCLRLGKLLEGLPRWQ